ncbi:copper chaperone PCu(A)C [Parapusillimonas sp. SGNA-6]|nr:copper chaperone PCu(A)C [Parapusillimonas sp. SGNA-6]
MKKVILAAMLALSSSASVCLAHGTGHAAHGAMAEHTAMTGHAAMAAHGPMPDVAAMPASTTLSVTACWIRSLPKPAPSAGYFVIKNSSSQDVKLTGASSPAYGMVMLHQTTEKDGMSRMSETEDVVIPANGELEFKPGGYHAMLEQPTSEVVVGGKVDMAFAFSTNEKATAQCDIKPANTRAH